MSLDIDTVVKHARKSRLLDEFSIGQFCVSDYLDGFRLFELKREEIPPLGGLVDRLPSHSEDFDSFENNIELYLHRGFERSLSDHGNIFPFEQNAKVGLQTYQSITILDQENFARGRFFSSNLYEELNFYTSFFGLFSVSIHNNQYILDTKLMHSYAERGGMISESSSEGYSFEGVHEREFKQSAFDQASEVNDKVFRRELLSYFIEKGLVNREAHN